MTAIYGKGVRAELEAEEKQRALTAALRRVADYLDEHPELADQLQYPPCIYFTSWAGVGVSAAERREWMRHIARMFPAPESECDKHMSGFVDKTTFAPVSLRVHTTTDSLRDEVTVPVLSLDDEQGAA